MNCLEPIFGFDRVDVWFDVADIPLPLEALNAECTAVKFQVGSAPFGARWKSKVQLFQPTRKALKILLEGLPSIVSAKLTYAEIAFDITCPNGEVARQLLGAFLSAARMVSQRQPVILKGTVWYFGRRTKSTNSLRQKPTGRPHRLAAYADRPSKLHNAKPTNQTKPACHIEWRASGSTALANLGIVTLKDLIAFDHLAFFGEHVRLYALPKGAELGRLLARCKKANPDVSGTALRKRAAIWRQAATQCGKFILHNALLGRSNVAKRLETVPWNAWWRHLLQKIAA